MAKKPYSQKISDILLRNNMIEKEVLQSAEEEALAAGTRLEKYLIEKKLVQSDNMTLAISEYLKMPPITLAHLIPNQQLLELLPKDVMVKRLMIPIARVGKSLTVAVGDPFDLVAIDEVAITTGLRITPLVAAEKDITDMLDRVVADQPDTMDMSEIFKEADDELDVGTEKVEEGEDENLELMIQDAHGAPVVRMVNMMLLEALRTGASDIHVEPQEKGLSLRYRIDGDLNESPAPPRNLMGAIISRMKLMSGMDIAQRRIPQDGRMKIRALGKEVDLRVNTLPTIHGEKICLRILDKSALFPNLAALGLDPEAYQGFKHAIEQPNGILLVTGPTGSGKTTTLYSCLQELNTSDVAIITCEDPVEYQLAGMNQVQINSFVGLTFAAALRSILRQAPDIILVGETRDSETAEIAVKAALTGHLVLSTLHTNDACGAITRMIDMGVEPSLLASALILSQAQRLMRRLCTACKKPTDKVPETLLKEYGIDPAIFKGKNVHAPRGCPKCHNSGYKGRVAIMEVLTIGRELRNDIVKGLPIKEIAEKARKKGMLTLKDVGMNKAKDGLTSIEEALSVTGGE